MFNRLASQLQQDTKMSYERKSSARPVMSLGISPKQPTPTNAFQKPKIPDVRDENKSATKKNKKDKEDSDDFEQFAPQKPKLQTNLKINTGPSKAAMLAQKMVTPKVDDDDLDGPIGGMMQKPQQQPEPKMQQFSKPQLNDSSDSSDDMIMPMKPVK